MIPVRGRAKSFVEGIVVVPVLILAPLWLTLGEELRDCDGRGNDRDYSAIAQLQ
jgi:hypothetical protein